MQQYLTEHGPVEGENCGRGVACGFWAPGCGPAAAHVNLNNDGTVALDAFGGATGTTYVSPTSAAFIGTDLTDDHPIAFTFNDALECIAIFLQRCSLGPQIHEIDALIVQVRPIGPQS